MTYPGQRVQADVKVVPRKFIAGPELRLFQYIAIDAFTPLRFLGSYPEQSTYSSANFLKRLFKWYARRGIRAECVQTDKRFYSCHSFYSLDDFAKQVAIRNRRSNNFHMRPLGWLSPSEFTIRYI